MSTTVVATTEPNFVIVNPHVPKFETSQEVREKHIAVVDYINTEMADKSYIIYARQEDGVPKTRFTIGAGRLGIPEMVIVGSVDPTYVEELFRRVHDVIAEMRPIEHADYTMDDWIVFLNEALDQLIEFSGYYKFVPVDTEQFMNGVGLNCKRWYGDCYKTTKVVQLLYTINGSYPDEAEYPHDLITQVILPSVPYGNKHVDMPKLEFVSRPWHVKLQ